MGDHSTGEDLHKTQKKEMRSRCSSISLAVDVFLDYVAKQVYRTRVRSQTAGRAPGILPVRTPKIGYEKAGVPGTPAR